MQSVKQPYFNKGRILKREMLYLMSGYPRDALEIYNENLSDGIVCGLTPRVDKDIITFSKGIVKYNGLLYLLNSPTSLSYGETEAEVLIKLCFYDELRDSDYISQFFEIEIDTDTEVKTSQQELGRFKLKKGAYLRSSYQSLADFTTEYNTINIINVLYAGMGEPTLSGKLLKYFAEEALAAKTQNPMDITFCMLCVNSERVERQAINSYISYRLDEESKTACNKELHKKLVRVMDKIHRENTGSARGRAPQGKIIVG
jgi:hypothetical protein